MDEDLSLIDEMRKITGGRVGTPLTVKGTEYVLGFNADKLKALVKGA